jgi:hypothetical protein
MTDRLQMIKEYYRNNQESKVRVTIPPTKSETTKGTVIRYFEGSRGGYWFKNGQAWVNKGDLNTFRQGNFIIHDNEGGTNQ